MLFLALKKVQIIKITSPHVPTIPPVKNSTTAKFLILFSTGGNLPLPPLITIWRTLMGLPLPLFGKSSNVGWSLLKRFVRYIISRNHSNTFLLINLQKTKSCPKSNNAARAACANIRLLTI